ncbi:MAG: dihydroneopterin aldolase family protein [Promethearchaeota archaeon]|jgi:hypothetical protein
MSDKIIEEYFTPNLSNRERAAFELGIKFGALFHIAIGIPISKNEDVLASVEKGLEESINCQPYVSSVVIKLPREKIEGEKRHEFDYSGISPRILNAEIGVDFRNVSIKGRLEWVEELKHPLMYISKIESS